MVLFLFDQTVFFNVTPHHVEITILYHLIRTYFFTNENKKNPTILVRRFHQMMIRYFFDKDGKNILNLCLY